MQSYVCGKNVWYDFCSDGLDSCYSGDRVNSGAGFSKNYAVRHMNNRLSYAVLGPYDPREIGAVTLFEDDTCSGASGRFYWDPESNQSGTHYNEEDLYYGGMRNNRMSSFTVPKGYVVELIDGHGFDGRKQVVEGSYKNDSEELTCFTAEHNDRTSSMIIKRQPQGAAVARWQSITSTESLDIEYHTGLSYDNQSNSQWEEADRMNAALDLGLTFLSIFIPPLALIPRQRNVVQRDVTTTYAYDYAVGTSTSCTVPEGSDYGAGLWQWVVSTEDGRTNAYSRHTVCRTGQLFNVAPECPYYACANADCSTCIPDWEFAL